MGLRDTFVKLFQDAAIDKPSRPSVKIVRGEWVVTIKGNQSQWAEFTKAACIPSHAKQNTEGDTLTICWESYADSIFGENGLMAKALRGYEVRLPQLHMARLVQRSIEMGEPAIIEAGTGTGKSFAYAAVAMIMNRKCIISTSNKALQAQLYQKDIPFLCKLFPGKKVALAQGKGNYLCRLKCQEKTPDMNHWSRAHKEIQGKLYRLKLTGEYSEEFEREAANVRDALNKAIEASPVNIDNYPLEEFYKTTDTGNTEELEVHVHEVNRWTADDDCTGRKCLFHAGCFYYQAKEKRNSADVVICNHALLILDRLYPEANILPGCQLVVVDEAHKLMDYARNALGHEFTMNKIEQMISKASEYINIQAENISYTADAERTFQEFWKDVSAYCVENKNNRQVGVQHSDVFHTGISLANELTKLADLVWNPEDSAEDEYAVKQMKFAGKLRNLADMITAMSSETQDGHVRWVEPEVSKLVNVPFNVSDFIGRMASFETNPVVVSGTTCARCGRELSAMVHVLDGKAYGPDCIRHVDLFDDAEVMPLAQWSSEPVATEVKHKPTAIIFTSATIAAPSLDHFMSECGLSHGFQMVVTSPFDYASNALLYVPNGDTPEPNNPAWQSYLVDDIKRLVLSAGGGAFLLFTSYNNMNFCVKMLSDTFERAGLKVFVQGKLPKGEITKQFRQNGNAVLFATKSYWEGISIEGAALRLVVIDKMPFQAPSPLLKARESVVNRPFFDLHLPEMIIDLKQGVGRLIRRMDDYGVIALLDSKVRLKSYGRDVVLPSMPPARLTSSLAEIGEFFEKRKAIVMPVLDFPVAIDQHVVDELVELGF